MKFLDAIYYSLPVQLVVMQLRNHKGILLFWFILALFISEYVGADLGVPYLFLKPEYLGEVSFGSMFLLGIGMGAFIGSYNIAMYILDSYRFFFLALERWPFYIFFLNNFIVPTAFLILFTVSFIRFEMFLLGEFTWDIMWYLLAFYLAITLVFILISIYFSATNKDIRRVFGKKFLGDIRQSEAIKKAKQVLNIRYRVDNFFILPFRVRQVDKNIKADFRTMVQILNQNHGNALFFEFILLVIIIGIGLLDENPYFQIPSGMSILLLLSIFLMFIGAFAFWTRRLGAFTLIGLVAVYFALDYGSFFEERHPAYGMNYQTAPASYNVQRIEALSSERNRMNDYLSGIITLERWKSDYEIFHGKGKKPKAIITCTSGGGMRAMYFSMKCIQTLDDLTNGKLMEHTRLMAGASGGMIGQAYYRELYLQKRLGLIDDIHDPKLSNRAGMDLLNPVSVKIVTGLFLPYRKVQFGMEKYYSDRGYSFDRQLTTNLGVFQDRRLGDYTRYEEEALIPQLIMNPVLINDGRILYISSSNVSYLNKLDEAMEDFQTQATGIELTRYFEDQAADSLWYPTALRMNASFPLITPFVQLPSEPVLETIDAGIVDNFGIQTAVKYLYTYRDWFARNTDGVLILSIRDSDKHEEPKAAGKRSVFQTLFNPLGDTYASFSKSRGMANDDYLNFTKTWYKGELKFLNLEYIPEVTKEGMEASLSWHLTEKEKVNIDASLMNESNQECFQMVKEWLEE